MTVDCAGLTTREINAAVRKAAERGDAEVTLANPGARHNLAVGIVRPLRVVVDGSAGYYCAGMGDGPDVEVRGNAGWGAAEGIMAGRVTIRGNAGNGAAASIRGGTVVVHGHAGARPGIALKGGTLLIGGNAGMMAGFMGQKGRIVICGDAGPGAGDSMYETEVFVGGRIEEAGADTEVKDATPDEVAALGAELARHGLPAPASFKKIVSARKLWNFSKHDFAEWKKAL